ncbi:hypothetical protein MRB53_005799 [Persea americana]|uniref:Uncharacterized protein n=1 Tax=Persea americana TaxID=3435 RepID=A0ACC2ME29_PERAE|nr:hypothetical protein MRB53_005799 [Persea americana]
MDIKDLHERELPTEANILPQARRNLDFNSEVFNQEGPSDVGTNAIQYPLTQLLNRLPNRSFVAELIPTSSSD